MLKPFTNLNSSDKNVKIVRSDIIIRVQTLTHPLMCEFIMTLLFRRSNKKKCSNDTTLPTYVKIYTFIPILYKIY